MAPPTVGILMIAVGLIALLCGERAAPTKPEGPARPMPRPPGVLGGRDGGLDRVAGYSGFGWRHSAAVTPVLESKERRHVTYGKAHRKDP